MDHSIDTNKIRKAREVMNLSIYPLPLPGTNPSVSFQQPLDTSLVVNFDDESQINQAPKFWPCAVGTLEEDVPTGRNSRLSRMPGAVEGLPVECMVDPFSALPYRLEHSMLRTPVDAKVRKRSDRFKPQFYATAIEIISVDHLSPIEPGLDGCSDSRFARTTAAIQSDYNRASAAFSERSQVIYH